MKTYLKKISMILIFWGSSFTSPNFAQEADSLLKSEDLLFKFNHHTLFFESFLSKGNISKSMGKADLANKLGVGFTGGWLYTYNLSRKFAIETGLSVGVLPIRYSFNLDSNSYNVPYNYYNYGTQYIEFVSIPLNLVYRQKLKNKLLLNIRAGLRFRKIILEDLEVEYLAESQRILYLHSLFDNSFRINYRIGLGISKLLTNSHLIELQLIYNLSVHNVIDADYIFLATSLNDNLTTIGKYKSKGSYLGLNLSYTFTKVNKYLKRLRG